MQPATELGDFLGGFVAAEGSFISSTHRGRTSFTFAVALGASDERMCHTFAEYLGVGRVRWYPRRRPHYDDEVVYVVRAYRDLIDVVVPFMDEHLPPSYKREQYIAWRAALLDHWEHDAKRVRPCTVEGCDEPRRAKGLCRRHYYAEHGR